MSQVSAEQIRAFMLDELNEPLRRLGLSAEELPDDFDLHGSGVIDSFGLIELIAAIEERFDISVDFEELDPDELTSIGPLARFIDGQSVSAGAR
jgi:acyl carrier protein